MNGRSAIGLEKLRALASEPLDTAMQIERDAASIATAMAKLHGEKWRVQIDHLARFVLVVRK